MDRVAQASNPLIPGEFSRPLQRLGRQRGMVEIVGITTRLGRGAAVAKLNKGLAQRRDLVRRQCHTRRARVGHERGKFCL